MLCEPPAGQGKLEFGWKAGAADSTALSTPVLWMCFRLRNRNRKSKSGIQTGKNGFVFSWGYPVSPSSSLTIHVFNNSISVGAYMQTKRKPEVSWTAKKGPPVAHSPSPNKTVPFKRKMFPCSNTYCLNNLLLASHPKKVKYVSPVRPANSRFQIAFKCPRPLLPQCFAKWWFKANQPPK